MGTTAQMNAGGRRARIRNWPIRVFGTLAASLIVVTPGFAQPAAQAGDSDDRAVLPLPVQPTSEVVGPSLETSTPYWAPLIEAPAGAPNILLIMTDDVGFGAASTFGGPVPTPNLDRLASKGARYNNFHTTAMCSPTRASLLTGRNHHAVATGALTDRAMGFPGYTGEIPASAATIARVLRDNGYNTAMFGKDHNVPSNERGAGGPFGRWPTGLGFEEFYGFIGADTDQFHPTLFQQTQLVQGQPLEPGELLDEHLAERAIDWLDRQGAATPAKPFFMYFAPGTAHAPHQAPPEWIARFRGKFDGGWDAMRERSVARQIAQGLIPAGTRVTARPGDIPAWNTLDADHRRLFARYMEVYAATLAFQDHQIGRILDEIERTGRMDNTLVVFIEGDNGASGEGGLEGSLNELANLTGQPDKSFAQQLADIDQLGGPDTYQVYPAGWAWALNAPFPQFKQIASHLGGTRNGLVISWPDHIAAQDGVRGQFHHVVDIMPTLLEASHIAAPQRVDGVAQLPLDGVSMLYTLSAPKAPGRHRSQYFEMLGNRAMYVDGWLANTGVAREPWERRSPVPPEDYTWALYDLGNDFAQSVDLAKVFPERLAAMRTMFDREAEKYGIYPMRADLDAAVSARLRRPAKPRSRYEFWGAGAYLPPHSQPRLTGAFTIDCELVVPESASGALVATGSAFGGWSFRFEHGRPVATHRASNAAADSFTIAAPGTVGPGPVRISFRFTPDSDANGSGGRLEILQSDQIIGAGRIARTGLRPGGPSEVFNIGNDTGGPVTNYPAGAWFSGTIRKITVSIGD